MKRECPTCHGETWIRDENTLCEAGCDQGVLLVHEMTSQCRSCDGTGYEAMSCPSCDGWGHVEVEEDDDDWDSEEAG